MSSAVFETSGLVALKGPPGRLGAMAFADLSPFTQGYIEALMEELVRLLHNGGCKFGVRAFPDGKLRAPAFFDLAPETLARIMEDCALFQKPPADWVVFDFATGRDFWKDRQGRQLTRLSSQRFPPLTPYLGEDGKVYLREVAP